MGKAWARHQLSIGKALARYWLALARQVAMQGHSIGKAGGNILALRFAAQTSLQSV